MRSKGDVSRVFLATVSHGIGFLFVFNGFQRQRFGIFLAAMRSVGDVSDVLLSFSRAFQRRRFGSFCGVLLSLSVVLGFCFFACAPQVALRLFVRLLRPFLVFTLEVQDQTKNGLWDGPYKGFPTTYGQSLVFGLPGFRVVFRGFRRQRFESFLLAVS